MILLCDMSDDGILVIFNAPSLVDGRR